MRLSGRSCLAVFALGLLAANAHGQATPGTAGKTIHLGHTDAGTLPTAIVAGCVYDTLRQQPLCTDGGSWSELHPSLPATCGDGGNALGWSGNGYTCAPVIGTAPIESASGYGVLNSEETPFAAKKAAHTGTGTTLEFTVDIAGVAGAGSAVLEVLDGATQRCILTFACNAIAGTTSSAACVAAFTAGNAVTFQWDSTSDCASLPLGNAAVTWQ